MEKLAHTLAGQAALTLYRGAKQIGGTCLEISQGKTRILFDCGLPLNGQEENSTLKIIGLYKQDRPDIQAIFITHAHPDHYGLLSQIHPQIPVYLTQTAFNVITKLTPLVSSNNIGGLNFKIIKNGQTVKIGDITVKAIGVDHSAADSSAFKIIAGGKVLAYSGDIRRNGRTAFKTDNFIKQTKNADYLILEGTFLSRKGKIPPEENTLTDKFIKEFKQNKIALVAFSSQNLERFISVYKAVRKVNKILVIDPYTAASLEYFKQLGANIPQYYWRNIRILFAPNKQTKLLTEKINKYAARKISFDEIIFAPQNYVLKANYYLTEKLFKHTGKVNLIHSMWKGYLTEDNIFVKVAQQNRIRIKQIHTSGHADTKTLQYIAAEINPKNIIPVHTEHPEKYKKLFGNKILLAEDNTTVIL